MVYNSFRPGFVLLFMFPNHTVKMRAAHFAFFLLFGVLCSKGEYSVQKKGTPNTDNYRAYLKDDGAPISPFHDIPLYANEAARIYNMIIEIPRWSHAKMEVNKGEELNPIIQDLKNDKLRYAPNVFPYHGYIWNYGALPQTWEDPDHVDEHTGANGDNDPIDAIEIGNSVAAEGDVKQVKVLGVLAMVDETETDWKLVCIDVNDSNAHLLHDIGDVRRMMPGLLEATRDWFRIYKMPAGKPNNEFGFNGEWQNRTFAEKIISETNECWKVLIMDEDKADKHDIEIINTSNPGTPGYIGKRESREIISDQDERDRPGPKIDASVNDIHYVQRTVAENVCGVPDTMC